jgi:hypothetical protein
MHWDRVVVLLLLLLLCQDALSKGGGMFRKDENEERNLTVGGMKEIPALCVIALIQRTQRGCFCFIVENA